ncbi:MAG: DUF1611 domain-containing protein [Rhodospirillaceae bacterium]|jgi:uncharacterized NAD-dependent epimerase/dehydratase family protein|nr:DUF1611 domain-containing protein [Rhodospirillaceae bacterium]MBT4690317.1 DUF1611 domain-containing protein [Rhodospirillaceae bacterium]MBT5083618.1 DUF1611 domain-containing protein [Rhodospirillaceae bacterium]MBT5526444.1 DUF1611 domain-containing protein [Rhodospirillaceae bacterium]MBT5878149.1 DUF1611 domain-containing protein [Rhodospirillaceae bacterium]
MKKPYLLFLGDAPDQLAAKTATGIADWRPEWCVGQFRLPGCGADTGQKDVSIDEAIDLGAKTLVIGVVNSGGFLPDSWTDAICVALAKGLDVASGLHGRLQDFPAINAAAEKYGRQLHNIRLSEQNFTTGKGIKRAGKRILTVGTDCSCGKKYTALAIERAMRARGLNADFRATGQTGVLIAERGVAIDAVIADFISGAAEWISPANDADHWDVIEGQGSLFHASYAGVSLGLMHGAQPDLLVLCHEPTRTHMRGLPHYPIPDLTDCIALNLANAKLTNPDVRMLGVSVNTSALTEDEAERYLAETSSRLSLPCLDVIRGSADGFLDHL